MCKWQLVSNGMMRITRVHYLTLSGHLIASILCLIYVAIHNRKGCRETAGYLEHFRQILLYGSSCLRVFVTHYNISK